MKRMVSPSDPKINELVKNINKGSISREDVQKQNNSKSITFKVYDEPVIVPAGTPILILDKSSITKLGAKTDTGIYLNW